MHPTEPKSRSDEKNQAALTHTFYFGEVTEFIEILTSATFIEEVKRDRSPRQFCKTTDFHMELKRWEDCCPKGCWNVCLWVGQVLLMCCEKSKHKRAVMKVDVRACEIKMHEQRGDRETEWTRYWLFIKWQRSLKDGGWEERGGARLRGLLIL